MPALVLLLAILLIGHLAILAASKLRYFGHVGAIQLCSTTFGLCDDPLESGNRADTMPPRIRDAEIGKLHARARSVQDPLVSWREDDFDVLEGDRVVGRIYRLHPVEGDWLWGILPQEMPSGRRATGREPSYEGAKAAFWAAWQSRRR